MTSLSKKITVTKVEIGTNTPGPQVL